MSLIGLITMRAESTPVFTLAAMSLRYQAVRSLSPKLFAALHRAAILDHDRDETFADAFDRHVDRVVLSHASERGAQL